MPVRLPHRPYICSRSCRGRNGRPPAGRRSTGARHARYQQVVEPCCAYAGGQHLADLALLPCRCDDNFGVMQVALGTYLFRRLWAWLVLLDAESIQHPAESHFEDPSSLKKASAGSCRHNTARQLALASHYQCVHSRTQVLRDDNHASVTDCARLSFLDLRPPWRLMDKRCAGRAAFNSAHSMHHMHAAGHTA